MTCPECGGILAEYPATVMVPWHFGFHCVKTGRGLEYRPTAVTVIACNGCEYVLAPWPYRNEERWLIPEP